MSWEPISRSVSQCTKGESQRAPIFGTWQIFHVHSDLDQDLCIEVQFQDAYRRDNGLDRGDNGSSEEAAAHCTSRQTTYDSNNTTSKKTIPSTSHCSTAEQDDDNRPNRASSNGKRVQRRKDADTKSIGSRCRHTRTSSGHHSRAKKKRLGKMGEAITRQHRGSTPCHPVYDKQ